MSLIKLAIELDLSDILKTKHLKDDLLGLPHSTSANEEVPKFLTRHKNKLIGAGLGLAALTGLGAYLHHKNKETK